MFGINKVTEVLLKVFVAVLIFDPSGLMFGLKELLLVLILLFYSLTLLNQDNRKVNLNALFIVVCIIGLPILSLFVSTIIKNEIDYREWFHFFKSHIMILLLLPLIGLKVKINKIINISLLLLSLATVIAYVFSVYWKGDFDTIYDIVVVKYKNGMYSYRSFLGYTVMSLFYKTSPLILLTFPIYFYRLMFGKGAFLLNLLASSITFFGLLFTGTRAPMLAAVMLLALIIGKFIYSKLSRLLAIGLIISIVVVSVIAVSVLLGDKKEESNMIKVGNVESYKKSFSNPKTLIFGDGVGSKIWFAGVKKYAAYTELSYLDTFRMYGLLMGSFLVFLFFLPVYLLFVSEDKENNILGYSYLLYLLVAGTNPLLISSTGFLALCYVYGRTLYRLEK